MRKITTEAVNCFLNGKDYDKSNTSVFRDPLGDKNLVLMTLHWNNIATYNLKTKELKIRDCGRQSNTTKERLNGILHHFWSWIYQKNWAWFFSNGKKWENRQRNTIEA